MTSDPSRHLRSISVHTAVTMYNTPLFHVPINDNTMASNSNIHELFEVVEYLISDISDEEKCITGSCLIRCILKEGKYVTLSPSLGLKILNQLMKGFDFSSASLMMEQNQPLITSSSINKGSCQFRVHHFVENMCACIVLSKAIIINTAVTLAALDVTSSMGGIGGGSIDLPHQFIQSGIDNETITLVRNSNWWYAVICSVIFALRSCLQCRDEADARQLLMLFASIGDEDDINYHYKGYKIDFSVLILNTVIEE